MKEDTTIIHDYTIDKTIGQKIIELNRVERLKHEPSGKLTASILAWPLQWQILKVLGVPSKEPDEYILRKFIRGKQVEDWVINHTDGITDTQVEVSYNSVIGYVDAIILHGKEVPPLENKLIPHEIKSVTNMKFKHITKTKEADPQHQLQAALYALALKSEWYAIDYVASDDLRVETFIYPLNGIKQEVDAIINVFNEALKKKIIPTFTPRYEWQKEFNYSPFYDWMDLKEDELEKRAKELYAKKGGDN